MRHSIFLYLLFASTIFVGSFLLFQVQPIIGKHILPWFGGTSFVWITSLLFFQVLLLAGYLYSYFLARFSLKTQLTVHLTIIVSIALLTTVLFFTRQSPILPSMTEKLPETVSPFLQVSAILLISVCLPYFLLATTSTLLQKWFSFFPHKKSPYTLYALSNVGSLLAIITYPILIEPLLPLHLQGIVWAATFLLFCLLLSISSLQLLRLKNYRNNVQAKKSKRNALFIHSNQWTVWLFLPAVSSLTLLAATTQMTKAIAPIPFLWLIPLGLYLLSFIICFSEKNLYWPRIYGYLFFFLLFIMLLFFILPVRVGVLAEIALYALFLFSSFMLCHGKLYETRPPIQYLNTFYLIVSFGSVIGAVIAAIIAPIFFIGNFWEFYLSLYFLALIAAFVLIQQTNSFVHRTLFYFFLTKKAASRFIIVVLSSFFLVLFLALLIKTTTLHVGLWRNFYGNLRVSNKQTAKENVTCLINGNIIHGCQFFASSALRKTPTTYYGYNSGLGLAEQSLRMHHKQPLTMGGIGLGVGTTAAYGKKGDTVTFYELNPQDITIAQQYFTYLQDSPAKIDIILGDGRLSMEKQLLNNQYGNYNLFFIDAFTDDAIPMHLLTEEAFTLYIKHLAPKDSIIAIHISNHYIDLIPVISELAKHFNMHIAIINNKEEKKVYLNTTSQWALLSFDKKLLETAAIQKQQTNLSHVKRIPLWTDDYSNIFQILK